MKKFLIVVDMQNDFISGALGSAEAEAIVVPAAEHINGFDGDIIVTYDTHRDDYPETAEGRHLPVPHCIKGTFGWELDSRIAQALSKRNYTSVEKDTFASVDLVRIINVLSGGEEFTVELMGLCTDICVVSNALLLKAYFPEAEFYISSALCAGSTPEKHDSALKTMKSCHINII